MGQETQKIQQEEKQEKKKRRISWFWLFFIPAALTGMGLGIYFGTKDDYSNSQINTDVNPGTGTPDTGNPINPGTGTGGTGNPGDLLPPDTSAITIQTADTTDIKFTDDGTDTWVKLPSGTSVELQDIKDQIRASDDSPLNYSVNGTYEKVPAAGTNLICTITATYARDNNITKTIKVLVDHKAPTVAMASGASLDFTSDIDTSHIADGYIEVGKNKPVDPMSPTKQNLWRLLTPSDDGMGIVNNPPISYGIQESGHTFDNWRDFITEIQQGVVSGETYYIYNYVDDAGNAYIGKDGTVGFKVIVHITRYNTGIGPLLKAPIE